MSLTPLSLILMTMFTPSQQHEQILPDGNRAGFLIGDGAGVGKGRTIAGVIYENYLKVSMSSWAIFEVNYLLYIVSGSKTSHLGVCEQRLEVGC